jgi:phosphoglycerate dehydrogenase-like enzyme
VKPQLAVLDDYQHVALAYADWDRLRERIDITVFDDHLDDEDALVERLAPFAAVVVVRERTPFPRSLVERLPNLRLLATTGMRNAAIDLVACEERGVVVCGTHYGGGGTAQLAWALILALAQQITVVDADIRAGRWQTGVGVEVAGRTLGLLGLGRLGTAVSRYARAFDMNVIAWSANLTAERAAEAGAELVERDELLRRADFVSIHLVLSERTRGLLGRRELALMKPSAYLVNTSRGPIVDEDALIEALASRRIAGAGLDVFAIEPLPAGHPLRRMPNTILTPHIGYVSQEGYAIVFPQVVENVDAWLNGAPIRRITPDEAVRR